MVWCEEGSLGIPQTVHFEGTKWWVSVTMVKGEGQGDLFVQAGGQKEEVPKDN